MAIQFLTPISAGQVKRLAEDSDYKKTSPNKKFEVNITISGETRTFTLDHLSNANSAIASALAKLAKERKEANVGRFIAINRKNATAKELTASTQPTTDSKWSGTYNHNGLDYSIAFVGTQEEADSHAANLNLKDVALNVELPPHLSISAFFLADQVFTSLAFAVSSTDVTSRINVTKPYKPRKLKNDPYHTLMRRAQKLKRPNPAAKAKSERTRKLWVQRNKQALKRRSEFVRKAKKSLAPTNS
jgi:hypothetical protein